MAPFMSSKQNVTRGVWDEGSGKINKPQHQSVGDQDELFKNCAAYSTKNENEHSDVDGSDDEMYGLRRGPAQTGFTGNEHSPRGRRGGHNVRGSNSGRGGRGVFHPGVGRSGYRAGPDWSDGGYTFLGRGRGGRGGAGGRWRAGSTAGTRSNQHAHPADTHAAAAQRDWPADPARRAVKETTSIKPIVPADQAKAPLPLPPPTAASTAKPQEIEVKAPSNSSAATASPTADATFGGEQTRRARRAQRAVLIFQEQRQQQQAEAVARQELAQADSRYSATESPTFTSLRASNSIDAIGSSKTSYDEQTTKKVTFQDRPTYLPANSAATTISSNVEQLISLKYPGATCVGSGPATTTTASGSTTDSSASTCVVTAAAATMESTKNDAVLGGMDADDGNESDDSGNFIMTRTAGKRRGNLSAADMLANGILDDINEDLNAVTEDDEEVDPIKRMHRGYMNEAIAMAQLALRTNETPVGCVLVHNGRVIAKGMNATNMTRNGTRHAELMCLNALFAHWDDIGDDSFHERDGDYDSDCDSAQDYDDSKREYTDVDWQNVDPSKGHLYPYGQKLHPARIVDQDIVRECSLYVTVEPCIMCASMLRQYGINKVYFGAANDKFGGTGGVLRIHMNSKPHAPAQMNATYIETYVTNMLSKPRRASRPPRGSADTNTENNSASAEPSTPLDSPSTSSLAPASIAAPTFANNNSGSNSNSNSRSSCGPPVVRRPSTIPIAEGSVPARDDGHGGNVEPGFHVEGGWGRNKAVFLLRQFYVQENGRAPAPRKKEGRAQRLVEQMKSENSNSVKLPPSITENSYNAEIEAELDSIPLEASSSKNQAMGPLGDISNGNVSDD